MRPGQKSNRLSTIDSRFGKPESLATGPAMGSAKNGTLRKAETSDISLAKSREGDRNGTLTFSSSQATGWVLKSFIMTGQLTTLASSVYTTSTVKLKPLLKRLYFKYS